MDSQASYATPRVVELQEKRLSLPMHARIDSRFLSLPPMKEVQEMRPFERLNFFQV